ncbi:MAG: hypothetical protein E7265_00100 [Lachnospiraceae bacterium]|nr:hypothetical protein [Lachnospiraceae bacterium]
MDDKYIAKFITLLGASVASVILAIRVFFNYTDINRALIILIVVIVLFYIIGLFAERIIRKIRYNVKQRLMEEHELKMRENQENAENAENAENEAESDLESPEYTEQSGQLEIEE